jgi:16S rRNA (guanine966-N2)-methyltransferase
MRIIAGIYRSRVLKSLRGMKLRPTSDRLRETLFNILGSQIEGSLFVDVYAGTGAVGIEALSRGAADVVFIEKHAPAANLIRQNLEALGITAGATILNVDALRGLGMLAARYEADPDDAADIIFLDPPWAEEEEYARVLRFVGSAAFLSASARVIVEHRSDFPLADRFGLLRRTRLLQQGDAALSFFQLEREAS